MHWKLSSYLCLTCTGMTPFVKLWAGIPFYKKKYFDDATKSINLENKLPIAQPQNPKQRNEECYFEPIKNLYKMLTS